MALESGTLKGTVDYLFYAKDFLIKTSSENLLLQVTPERLYWKWY